MYRHVLEKVRRNAVMRLSFRNLTVIRAELELEENSMGKNTYDQFGDAHLPIKSRMRAEEDDNGHENLGGGPKHLRSPVTTDLVSGPISNAGSTLRTTRSRKSVTQPKANYKEQEVTPYVERSLQVYTVH